MPVYLLKYCLQGPDMVTLQQQKTSQKFKKLLRLKWSNVTLVGKQASRGRPKGTEYTAMGIPKKSRAAKKKRKVTKPKQQQSMKLLSLADFRKSAVNKVFREASKHVMPKFIAGNLAHFARLRRENPVASMVLEMDENDDNYPNLSCEIMHIYPGYALGTYSIASAMLVLSVRHRVDPADIVETLKSSPSLLEETTEVTDPLPQSLVVGNYSLTLADMDTLKPAAWLNDNVSALTHIVRILAL